MVNQTCLNTIYIRTCVLKAKISLDYQFLRENLKTRLTTSKLFQTGNREEPYLSNLPDP